MSSESRKLVQIILMVGIVAALVRLGIVFYERHEAKLPAEAPVEKAINPDYYVVPKKLHAYDLESVRELTKQPVWVREGYRYYYFPYNARSRKVDLKHEAGLLGPIERLNISDVVPQPTPGEPTLKQLMAVFSKNGQQYAVTVGSEDNGNYQIVADEIFFIQNPRELYKDWPDSVWQAIENHQVKTGMSELQASFAVGMGVPRISEGNEKVVQYPNGGHPLAVTYRDGRAAKIEPGDGTTSR